MDAQTLFTSVTAAVTGGGLAALLAKNLTVKFAKQQESLLHEAAEHMVKKAELQRQKILEEAKQSAKASFEDELKKLDESHSTIIELQKKFEQDIELKQQELEQKQNEIETQSENLVERTKRVSDLKTRQQELQDEIALQEQKRIDILSHKCGDTPQNLLQQAQEEALAAEQLGLSRWLMEHGEQVKAEANRFAKDILLNVNARYCPTFIWPKIPFTVGLPNADIATRYFSDGSPLLSWLTEGTETAVETVTEEGMPPLIKISGGLGCDKEIIRLSLEEILGRGHYAAEAVQKIVSKNRKKIEKLNLKMGEEAVAYLGLSSIHPEILKLIGALNYRTSHRQNQYFHSVEVARLAGMIAQEVGVDPLLAKRSGLLHDIGKVLDYKIEGSHAVISGDYATRFGEHEAVVDTVLAHHNDKIVETAHAYILKAADAMSGARPGARVDMEEGYQKRIEGIVDAVKSFETQGVVNTAIMHAGREVHVFVDHKKVSEKQAEPLAGEIARKLESDVQFPGQIKVIVVRRTEVTAVA